MQALAAGWSEHSTPAYARLRPGASRIDTEPLFRRQMLGGEVDYDEITGRIGRSLLGAN